MFSNLIASNPKKEGSAGSAFMSTLLHAVLIVLAVVQSLMALSTISPSLSEQFSALVSLAVVTNVVPYVIALSALMVMMRAQGVTERLYRRNVAVALVAMLYSVYALYASGKDAV